MNKPRGYITACKDATQPTVMDLFPPHLRKILRPVGRLDKDTEGLLLFTNDGKWNQSLMSPDKHVPKTYFFHALGVLNEEKKHQLETGVLLRGQSALTAPADLTICGSHTLTDILPLINTDAQPGVLKNPANQQVTSGILTITQGKKHQVKRMLKAVDCYVVYLKRIGIGSFTLDDSLAPGEYRELSKKETEALGSRSL